MLLLCRYEKAEQYFLLTLDKLRCSGAQQVTVEKWEPLLNNLGHVSRKLKYILFDLCNLLLLTFVRYLR